MLAGLVFTCTLVFGQAAGDARLTGQVLDQTGAVMPNVDLELESVATTALRTTTSNQDGYFNFGYVKPGNYKLTAKFKGFSTAVVQNITLTVNQTASVNVTMKPGEVQQEISVSGESVALQSQSSDLGAVVTQQTTSQIPLLLRDPTQLVTLVAGVTSDHRGEGGNPADAGGVSYQGRLDFEISGGFRSQAISMVDGVDITIAAGSFLSTPVVPTADFTQEFKVMVNNYSADFGRGAGVLNIVTRSGTNQFHGTAFEFLQNDNLNANNLFSNTAGVTLPESKRNQFGGAVGGPIRKDKTFFYFNGEWLRQRRFSPVTTRVPTNAEKNGDFSQDYALNGTPITLYNPFDTYVDTDGRVKRRPFPNNQIPQTALGTFANNLVGYYPSPNNSGLLGPGGVYTGIGNFVLGGSAPANYNRFDIKIDEILTPNHRIMGRYSRSKYTVAAVDVYGNVASPQSLSTRDNEQPGNNIVISHTWTINPTTVFTQSVNWARIVDDSTAQSAGFNPTTLGGPFANGQIVNYANSYSGGPLYPQINFGSGYGPQGDGFGNTFTEPFSNYQYAAGVVKTHGKHTFKFGFQGILNQSSDNLLKGFGSSFNFTGSWTCGPDPLVCSPFTGNGLADAQLGLMGSGAMNAGFSSMYSGKYFGFYVQDDLRITPKLTLNLGLRYDFQIPFTERNNHAYELDASRIWPLGSAVGPNTKGESLNQYIVGLGSNAINGAIVFPTTPGVPARSIQTTDKTNVSPRLGLAYQFTDKLVFRGGFSKLYMLSPMSPGPSTPGNGPFGATTNIISTVNGITPVTNVDNPYPNGFNVPIYDSQGLLSLSGDQVWGGAPQNKTPYQYMWNAGLQYELPGNTLLSVAYAGTRGRKLTCAFFFCGDQIPSNLIQQYGAHVFDTVPNPFYGIITNPLAPLSQPSVQLGQLLKGFPQYTSVVPILPAFQGFTPGGNSFHNEYNALQVQVTKRYSNGLAVQLAFTWSKNLTNTDSFEAGYLGPAIGYQNNYDYEAERSLSAADTNKRFNMGYVYDLPFGKGKRYGSDLKGVANQIVGGWQVSGITAFVSGYPMGISQTGHTTGAFGGGDRPNWVGNACVDSGEPRGERIISSLNPAGFARNPDFTYGNAPRTLPCRRDGVKNFDIGINKFFPIRENINIEFRTEFYNAFNRPQLGAPDTTYGSGSFGAITSQFNLPRVIQFGLKVNF